MGGGHMLFLATWEPRFKAVVATSTGIDPPREGEQGKLLTEEEAQKRYEELLAASKAEAAGRAGTQITTLQAWCPEPKEECVLPVKEAYDFYESQAKFRLDVSNKLSSTSFHKYTGG
jgi:hypothetical protein